MTVNASLRRVHIDIQGAVQGVGYRPFVYRLAGSLGLTGWVGNTPQGVVIEIQGSQAAVEQFLERLPKEAPALAQVRSIQTSLGQTQLAELTFKIQASEVSQHKTALILPDLATCPACLADMSDPGNRRYRYPFTNCTHCGPRFSIILALPYDRPNTTMRQFQMCEQCRAEYENPSDRRFHAQPNACPECGPQLTLWDDQGEVLTERDDALVQAAQAIRDGRMVAVKGLGGFHLIAAAGNDAAVTELRRGKHREEKPLAVMFPDAAALRQCCRVDDVADKLLANHIAPIVLLRSHALEQTGVISAQVAPGNPYLGAMLPYTPLHHLLLGELGSPVVATSGNLSDEPICYDEHEALQRLRGIADLFLVHNRPIARHVDDSIVQIVDGRAMVLRRARGYAPLPIQLAEAGPSVAAFGGHLKNSVAMSLGRDVFLSQHIGDLDTAPAVAAFREVRGQLLELYDQRPRHVACDLHPDYFSTQEARRLGVNVIAVQHHYAHVLAVMAEKGIAPPVLGVAWDGTGYGPDGTVWGGEFLLVDDRAYRRLASLRPFPLPGGDLAVREPRRCAVGLLHTMTDGGVPQDDHLATLAAFSADELRSIETALERNINCPRTSSVGRLFDVVASLVGLRQVSVFEGQAAMQLEFAVDGTAGGSYEFTLRRMPPDNEPGIEIDWEPVIRSILDDLRCGTAVGVIAARFHRALVEMVVAVAKPSNQNKIVLSGGCFQNRQLLEQALRRLTQEGLYPFIPELVPVNDGGIALGQVAAAHRALRKD